MAGTGPPSPTACPAGYIYIPNMSGDGVTALAPSPASLAFYSQMCGGAFGLDSTAIPLAFVCELSTTFL